jgi:two-component system sensor histidine kinase YesM
MIQNDKNIYEAMSKINSSNYNKIINNTDFLNSLSLYCKTTNYIISIIPLTIDKKIVNPLYSKYPYSNLIYGNKELQSFIESTYSNKFSLPNTFPLKYDDPDYDEKTTITYFSRYFDRTNYNTIGYLMINLRKKSLFTNIDEYCSSVFDSTFIVDKNGNLIYKIGNINYDKKMFEENDNSNVKVNNKTYIKFNSVVETYPDWRIIGLVSKQSLMKNLDIITNWVYCIGLGCIIILVFISHITSKKITDPIYDIIKAMNMFEKGQWPDKLESKTEDELKYLISSFNKMVSNIKNLIEQIYREEEENKKLEVESIKTQLDLLHSQINPHFIHNTLNTINYLAIKNNQVEIREMIQSFNMLLRQSISTNRKLITLKEELLCVENYLNIQRYRYGDIVKLIYNIPMGLENCLIPKLILQPLIENSLYHGIVPKGFCGTIKIDIFRREDCINIRIIDDGVGTYKEKTKNENFNGITLTNVSERLRLYFGSEYKLNFYSKKGIGTSIEFNIPYTQ